jgi:hypothetical protein
MSEKEEVVVAGILTMAGTPDWTKQLRAAPSPDSKRRR